MNKAIGNGIEAFNLVSKYLEDKGWDADKIPDQFAYKAKKNLDLCPCIYYFQVKIDLEQFLFYIVPDIVLLPEILPAVAEYIARANFGMRIGNFELDYDGCQVCFRSSINFNGERLSEALIEGVIVPALEAFDEYFTGLARVIAGIDTPAHAIKIIEYGD